MVQQDPLRRRAASRRAVGAEEVQRVVQQVAQAQRVEDGCGWQPAVPNATQPPLFLARFSPKFRPFSVIFRPFSPSRRQEAGQRKGTAETRRKTGEKRPRNCGLSGVGIPCR